MGVIIIAAVLTLVVGGGTFYYLQEKHEKLAEQKRAKTEAEITELKRTQPPARTTDTTNWKTYRNEKYGFEVKYPSSWTIEDKSFTYSPDRNFLSVELSSPTKYDLPNYESGIFYSFCIDFTAERAVIPDGCGLVPKLKGSNEIANIRVDPNSPEYLVAQDIAKSAKIFSPTQ